MGRNLHQLLLNLNKLLSPSPIKNPNIFQDNESYIESLLRKLNNIKTSKEFNNLHDFLKVNHITSKRIQQPILNLENIQSL